jgi:hypothetical protein
VRCKTLGRDAKLFALALAVIVLTNLACVLIVLKLAWA